LIVVAQLHPIYYHQSLRAICEKKDEFRKLILERKKFSKKEKKIALKKKKFSLKKEIPFFSEIFAQKKIYLIGDTCF
jgi:hypothetical protein